MVHYIASVALNKYRDALNAKRYVSCSEENLSAKIATLVIFSDSFIETRSCFANLHFAKAKKVLIETVFTVLAET